jgi:hypothetical protein
VYLAPRVDGDFYPLFDAYADSYIVTLNGWLGPIRNSPLTPCYDQGLTAWKRRAKEDILISIVGKQLRNAADYKDRAQIMATLGSHLYQIFSKNAKLICQECSVLSICITNLMRYSFLCYYCMVLSCKVDNGSSIKEGGRY